MIILYTKYIEFMKKNQKVKEDCKKYCKKDCVYTWCIIFVGHYIYIIYIIILRLINFCLIREDQLISTK